MIHTKKGAARSAAAMRQKGSISVQLAPWRAEWRMVVVLGLFFLLANVMLWRAVYLKISERDFLEKQGEMRYERVQEIPAHRGRILDRHGEPLAVITMASAPCWIDGHHTSILRRIAASASSCALR